MISENRVALVTAPVTVLAPALALATLVVALNLLTDGVARVVGRSVERTLTMLHIETWSWHAFGELRPGVDRSWEGVCVDYSNGGSLGPQWIM